MKQIYSYHCKSCNHIFEEIKEVEDRHNCSDCPQCESEDTRKIISPGIRGVVNGVGKGNYNSNDFS